MPGTSDQRTAIYTHDRNLIVIAGAGSGKTYTLVERYLALLDANPDWPLNALVAITFTRKAAQEMRDRVRYELDQRRLNASDAAAQQRWTDRLASIESARIDTIHGLCAAILRANAAEAGIDPHFTVLDEIQAALLRDDVLDSVLQSAASDATAPLLIEYGAYAVRGVLRDLLAADLDSLPPAGAESWETRADRVIRNRLATPEFEAAAHWAPPTGWPTTSDRIGEMWRCCRDQLTALSAAADLNQRLDILRALASDIRLTGGSPSAWGGRDVFDQAKDVLKWIRAFASDTLVAAGDPHIENRAAQLLPLWEALIRSAQAAYRTAKTSASLLDFDDLEQLTKKLLSDSAAARARYRGSEFKHLLVDEFQDTNAAQWDIVRALADLDQPGSLFVVGDPKQSIYAFRGADVSVFEHVRDQILDRGGIRVPLAESFRSHRRLVDGCNQLFSRILVKDPTSPVKAFEIELGEPMTASRELHPASLPVIELTFVMPESLSETDEMTDSQRSREAAELAARLRAIVEAEGRIIWDKTSRVHRPIEYGDIAVLFQSTTAITVYEEALKAAGLPFVTVAGRGYYNRQEVWDVLNLLTALHNPSDDLALASALRSPLFSLSDNALLALRLVRDAAGERMPLWAALDSPLETLEAEQPHIDWARDCLYDLRALAGRVTIAELLEQALERTGFLATLTALPDGARRRSNVEKLVDKAHTSGHITLGAFTRYLQDMSSREVREGEAPIETVGAITLMSVHASKGLEFPLVALADSSWGWRGRAGAIPPVLADADAGLTCKVYDPAADSLVSSAAYQEAEDRLRRRELAERRRLLYVAATRAQDFLLVSGAIPAVRKDGAWKSRTWLGWLWHALDLDGRGFSPLPGTETVLDYDGWRAICRVVTQPAPTGATPANAPPARTAWDNLPTTDHLVAEPQPPPLLRPIRIKPGTLAQHLTATQIADLGEPMADSFHQQRFRQQVLYDAPARIGPLTQHPRGASGRLVGEIVHRLLGSGRLPEGDRLKHTLDSYAWELGLLDPLQRADAVQRAAELLAEWQHSAVSQWLATAQRVYRELPFVYRAPRRVIHGVLDVLFQRADGSWAVLDYKTADVPPGEPLAHHARRFHLQVGVYAAAVREQLDGITPDVYIHYIRYGQTVRVRTGEWEITLGKLEDWLGNILNELDWVD